MNSASWASFVSAGALGDSGPDWDDDEDRTEPISDPADDDIARLQALGYRAYRDYLFDGGWTIARWDGAIGIGPTAVEAWDDAIRRFLADHPDF